MRRRRASCSVTSKPRPGRGNQPSQGSRAQVRLSSIIPAAADLPVGAGILIMLSATAAAETATKTRMGKAEASEPRMEEARATKAEATEAWTEKAAAEPAVPASAK